MSGYFRERKGAWEPSASRRSLKPSLNNEAVTEAELDSYRRRRQRRRQAQRTCESRNQATSPDAELLQFAQSWAPYGGAPAGDILVRFGMTTTRFVEVLRRAMSTVGCDPEVARQLRTVYQAL